MIIFPIPILIIFVLFASKKLQKESEIDMVLKSFTLEDLMSDKYLIN